MSRRQRYAFTLIELLVVITIIGMLMSLLLPALANMKERGRQMTCSNNIRNLGQAMASFESKKQRYPGYLNVLKKMDNSTTWQTPGQSTNQGASWAIMLMPFLELDSVYTTLRSTAAGGTSGGGTVIGAVNGLTRIELFICASDPPATLGGTFLGYVVNSGGIDSTTAATVTIPRDWADNGVFFDRYSDDPANGTTTTAGLNIVSVSSSNIKDGTGTTLMLAENVDAGSYADYIEETLGFTMDISTSMTVGAASGDAPPSVNPALGDERRINNNPGGREIAISAGSGYTAPSGGTNTTTGLQRFGRPSSNHRDGVNVVFCDSHTTFLSEEIDYYVYCLLMSSNGAGQRVPGAQTSTPGYNRPLNDTWIRK